MPLLAKLQPVLAALLLAAALLLGGGQGTLGDTACQVLAAGLIASCLWRHVGDDTARLPRTAWLALLPFLLPLLQLLPLPAVPWQWAPERAAIAQDWAAIGADASHRLSLVPLATERALLWLLPAAAVFLAGLQAGPRQLTLLWRLVVVIAVAGVVLGLAQRAGGVDSPLRFYDITNPTEAVGFYANRNHFAGQLAAVLPMVVVGTALWLQRRPVRDAKQALGLMAGLAMVVLLILGIALARSRAGLLLGMLGLVACAPVLLQLRSRRRGTRRVLAVAIAVGVTLSLQFALFGILQRLERDPLEDVRVQLLSEAAPVSEAHSPWGAGLGGYRRAFEAKDPQPGTSYINHAHNDYLELWLDAGWVGVPVVLAGLLLLGWLAWRPFRRDPGADRDSRLFGQAAAIALVLMLLHSAADYPLRTTAHLALLGLVVATAVRGAGTTRPRFSSMTEEGPTLVQTR